MEQEQAILSFDNVVKYFKQGTGSVLALDKLSLQLYPGMVVGLLGKNGAGKSTLIRCALGIMAPTNGTISVLGEPATQLSADTKLSIGYVPQQQFGYEGFTVRNALDLHSSFYPNWDKELEQYWLDRFQLDEKQSVQKLSVGQRQSLSLIMAMAYRPKLLVLDEPVASLDPIARRQFMGDIFELALESGSAVLFSSHITSDLERVASHVALIKEGQLVLFDEMDNLREHIKVWKVEPDFIIPEHICVLAKKANQLVVKKSGKDLIVQGVLSESSLNLENLFVELHQ
ncbi:ABC transporter ATP-binding protein [Shewanella sp. 202IG2-18]|uniref:ABC transporter ATP-binding protein n=1 Tax=Parashewanella hymeniacidonis TaxID=2807618 RepID=UPI0019607D42|nr:ABC transporter ATP-binding protein [Parashewanella hymeniacidonis]MBM7071832.1 ABC transporter ATP-binding protein [Parashewanella hymeniacidonis]